MPRASRSQLSSCSISNGSFLVIPSLLLALATAPGCTHRATVLGDEPDAQIIADAEPPDAAVPDLLIPDLLIVPDGPRPDQVGPSAPCTDRSAKNPNGRKPVIYRESLKGDWRVAIDVDAAYTELSPAFTVGGAPAAATIDNVLTDQETAGFVLSRVTTSQQIKEEFNTVMAAISTGVGKDSSVSLRASGTHAPSHDLYPAVKGTILDIKVDTQQTAAQLRNELVAAMLGGSSWTLGNLPPSFVSADSKFVVRLVILKRHQHKLHPTTQKPLVDKQGYGIDSGDKSKWRLVVMGSVARRSAYESLQRPTGFLVDDLSNGTSLAHAGATTSDGCATETITMTIPRADIIWVSDESSSMDDNRNDVVNNANNFFARALSSGLDFRMGVTNVCDPNEKYAKMVGKFCSVASADWSHDGGADRFLLPKEKGAFSGCIKNPPGGVKGAEFGLVNARAAVSRHLPRSGNQAHKIRSGAKLVIIVLTDEYPNSLNPILNFGFTNPCALKKANQAELDKAIKPYHDYFSGAQGADSKAILHVIGGVCSNACGALVAHGYRDLSQKLGGMVADICQKDLGPTLQQIIDHTVGAVSPLKLKHVPISATLAVSRNGISVLRSRTKGFQYREAENSIALINIKYQKGMKVVVGYKRWN